MSHGNKAKQEQKPQAPPKRQAKKDKRQPHQNVNNFALGTLSQRIPTEVNNRMVKSTRSVNPIAKEYFKMLINPFDHQSRMPDGQLLNTALFVSRRLIDIRVNLDAAQGNDAGRFGVMIRPRLGLHAQPQDYTINYVNTDAGWPRNLDVPEAWVQSSSGADMTTASDVEPLIQPPLTIFSRGEATGAAANVAGDNCVFRADTAPMQVLNKPLSSIGMVDFQYVPYNPANVVPSTLLLEPGQYIVTVDYRVSYAVGVTDTIGTSPMVGGGVIADSISAHVTSYTTAGVFRSRNSWVGLVTVSNQAGAETLWFRCGEPGGTHVIDNQVIVISTTWAPNVRPALDSGVLETIRPVAMAGYFKVALSPLDSAGRVTNYQIDAGQVDDVFGSSTSSNNPIRWEFSTTVQNSHNGPLGGGAYSYWVPDATKYSDPLTMGEHMKMKSSALVFSGYFKPLTTPTNPSVTVAQLEILTIFEGTTSSTIYPKKSILGSREMCDQARNLIRHESVNIPQHMNNDKHKSIIDKAVSTIDSVAKIGSIAATLAGFFF